MLSLTVEGMARADTAPGSELHFRARAEVPRGAGVIVEVWWDFDGSGRFAEGGPVAAAPRVTVECRRAFPGPGTWFPAVRAVARRQGSATGRFARLQNVARVRVVVGDTVVGDRGQDGSW